MPRHIHVRVAENLGQHVDRHPVLDRHAGERVPGAVRRQVLVEVADHGQLLQVTVHPLVTRHGEQLSSFQRGAFVLGEHFQRIGQQRYPAHDRRLLPWLVNPRNAVLIGCEMLFAQVFGICERQSRHKR